jgi:hypothetical protein
MLVLLIVVAATGGLVLLGLAIALLVQLRRVSLTVAALNRELAPLLSQIREDVERARERLQDLAERHAPGEGKDPAAAPTGRR